MATDFERFKSKLQGLSDDQIRSHIKNNPGANDVSSGAAAAVLASRKQSAGVKEAEQRATKAAERSESILQGTKDKALGGTDFGVSGRVDAAIGGGGDLNKDIVAGARFGEAVLGPEGLGKLGESKNIQDIQARFQDLSQGLSDKETVAARESGLVQINARQQAAERALQSRLGASGVKGGAAGGQFRELALGGLQQKQNLERDLILADRDARVQGLSNLAEFTTNTEQFDIGQAAKEKNIAIQTGLGFGALGAAERGAKISAEAAKAAAGAGGGGGKK